MSVKIRLRRMGAKKRPFYRLVVADARSPRDGRFIEAVGTYDPLSNPATVKIDADRVKDWISKGARPTDIARQLLISEGLLERTGPVYEKKADGSKPSKKAQAKAAEAAASEAAAAAAPAPEPEPEPEAPVADDKAPEAEPEAPAAEEKAPEPEPEPEAPAAEETAAEPVREPEPEPEKSAPAEASPTSPSAENEPEAVPDPKQHAQKPAEGAAE